MSAKRILLEIGSGNDLHGGDYTKAAVRAVNDALHHSSLVLLPTFNIDPNTMMVEVTVGVQRPEKVDANAVKAALRHGQVKVKAVNGGLDIPNETPGDITVIATAAIEVHLDLHR